MGTPSLQLRKADSDQTQEKGRGARFARDVGQDHAEGRGLQHVPHHPVAPRHRPPAPRTLPLPLPPRRQPPRLAPPGPEQPSPQRAWEPAVEGHAECSGVGVGWCTHVDVVVEVLDQEVPAPTSSLLACFGGSTRLLVVLVVLATLAFPQETAKTHGGLGVVRTCRGRT